MAPASHSHSRRQPHEYLDALLTALPNDAIPPEITAAGSSQGASTSQSQSSHVPYSKFIDTALRLASGGPSRPDDAPSIRDTWPEIQTSLQRALHALHPSSSSPSSSHHQQPAKRKNSPSSASLPNTINSKKPKYEDAGDVDDDDDKDDVPQLTLHAIPATAPVRHKIDITLHTRTLRLAHSTTGASSARCARTALTRAFLLPTRALSSGALRWTALLLAGDKPAPPARRGGKGAKATAAAVRFELACSVPDSSNPATIPRMTVHPDAPTSTPVTTTSAREAVFTLLSSTISGTPVALATVERGVPLAGITAFRGVRETSLWFFDDDGANANAGAGILADGRPAEFWALKDLARGEAGVRVRTATGRTCSVILMRRRGGDDGTGEHGDGEEEEEGEDEGEETEFQMIDGKERERILEWVRRHRGAFGIGKIREGEEGQASSLRDATRTANGKEKETGGGQPDSDASDSDFEASEASDGGSPSSSGPGSGSGSDVGSDAGTGSEEGGEGESGSGSDDDEDVIPLDDDPKHHPLLRAGALPKMSRAAMDAAVELVVGDLVGQDGSGKARRDASSSSSAGSSSGLGRVVGDDGREGGAVASVGDDDEEDELDD